MESRELPPDAVTQRVLSQLSNILHLDQVPLTAEKPRLPLNDLWFWTTAHSTDFPGLCASDVVIVHFRRASERLEGADTKVTAESISAGAHYHLLRTPEAPRPEALEEAARLSANEDCAKLDPSKEATFTADDEEDAVEGVWLTEEAIRLGNDPNLIKLIDCKRFPEVKGGCASVVGKASITQIDSIERCDGDNFYTECRKVYLLAEGLSLRIYAQDKAGSPAVIRVEPEEVVTTGDRLLD